MSKAILIFILLLVACNKQSAMAPDMTVKGQFSDPRGDAAKAVKSDDLSLLGVYGITDWVPGIDAETSTLRAKFKIKIIDRTSDDTRTTEEKLFNTTAKSYAEKYNEYIFKKIGCDVHHPMTKCTNYP